MSKLIEEYESIRANPEDYEGYDEWLNAFCPPLTDEELEDLEKQ